jgi:MarR family transcriptional regulator for hemolysin
VSPVPPRQPIGLMLSQVSRVVSRAFDERLAEAGGSLPIWLVLLALKTRPTRSQADLAAAVGIRGATLSHHLDGMESAGLLTRRRDPGNRRLHLVELTPAGTDLFHRLRAAAVAHDGQLRTGLSDDDVTRLADLLDRLRRNVAETPR